MMFNLKKNCLLFGVFGVFFVYASGLFAATSDTVIDPDAAVLNAVTSMCNDNAKLQTLSTDELNNLLVAIDSLDSFLSDPVSPLWDSTKKSTLKNNVQLVLNAKAATTSGTGTTTTTTPGTTTTPATEPATTPGTGTTTTPVSAIDTQVVAAVNAALKKAKAVDKINALINLVKKFGTKTVAAGTSNTFAAAIMTIGGTLIASKAALINSYAAKKTYTAADKNAIKAMVKTIKNTVADIAKFNTLLKNSANSKLLTAAQKTYVKNTLIPLITKINKLGTVK